MDSRKTLEYPANSSTIQAKIQRKSVSSNHSRSFIKNGLFYAISIVLTKAGHFILLPLYWTVLEPEDFGIIGLCQMMAVFLLALFDLGTNTTVQRMYFEWSDEERPKYVCAVWGTSILFSFIVGGFLYQIGDLYFSSFIESFPFDPYGKWVIISSVFQNITLSPVSIMRVRENLKGFSFYSIGYFLTQSVFILVSLFVFGWGVKGYIGALLLCNILFGFGAFIIMLGKVKFPKEVKYFKQPFTYSAPLVPSSIIESISGTIERFFLEKYASLLIVGYYSLSYQLASILNVGNQVLKSSFVPLIYKIAGEKDAPKTLGNLSKIYLGLITIPAVLISIWIKEVVYFTEKAKYYPIVEYIPYMVFGFWLLAITTAFGRGIDLSKKTFLNPIIPLSSILTSIVSSIYLIPKYGIWGALVTFLLAQAVKGIIGILLAYWVYPRPTHYRDIALILLVYFASVLIDLKELPVYSTSIVLNIALGVFSSYVILVILFGKNVLAPLRSFSFKKVLNENS